MAPTSDGRREVAERMRNDGRALDAINATVELASLTLDNALGIDHMCSWCDVFERLADLIDPTCHVIPGKAVAELKDGTRLTGVLLSCGHAVFGVSAKDMPRFCCECGARITNEVGDD